MKRYVVVSRRIYKRSRKGGTASSSSSMGQPYRRHEPGEVEYHSLCGSLHIKRWTYREIGIRNGTTRVPMEIAAGIIQKATPALALSLTQGFAKGPLRS